MVADRRTTGKERMVPRILKGCQKQRIWHPCQGARPIFGSSTNEVRDLEMADSGGRYQPGAAFIRIRGFSCPRLICASLSGSVAALTWSINANTFNTQMAPRTSFVDEPIFFALNPPRIEADLSENASILPLGWILSTGDWCGS